MHIFLLFEFFFNCFAWLSIFSIIPVIWAKLLTIMIICRDSHSYSLPVSITCDCDSASLPVTVAVIVAVWLWLYLGRLQWPLEWQWPKWLQKLFYTALCTALINTHCTVHYSVHCTVRCTQHSTVHCTMHCTVHCTLHFPTMQCCTAVLPWLPWRKAASLSQRQGLHHTQVQADTRLNPTFDVWPFCGVPIWPPPLQ